MQLDVIGVGPQKTGTTWFDECLREHPALCFPRDVKETFFFDERFARGWPWYWSHFRPGPGQLCIEIGASYFDVPGAAYRLRDHNPDCRIVITLRDPAARSFSLYLHHVKKGRLTCGFEEARSRLPRIVDGSRYRGHLERWIDLFGRSRVLVLLLDDVASAPEAVLQRVWDFLGLPPLTAVAAAHERVYAGSLPASPRLARAATRGAQWLRAHRMYDVIALAKRLGLMRIYNGSGRKPPPLDLGMRRRLVEELEPDIAYVESLLGRLLPAWRHAA